MPPHWNRKRSNSGVRRAKDSYDRHASEVGSDRSCLLSGFSWWIVVAMVIHVLLAGHSARTKSATFDEPVHTLGALLQTRYADYRVNPEHPPLWKFWAGLATIGLPFSVDLYSPDSRSMLANVHRQEPWAIEVLFRSEGNAGARLIEGARLPMLAFGATLVFLVGLWAGALGGRLAGALSAGLAAVDPNLLAHSGLVTNDVACAAALLACFLLAWRLTLRASAMRLLAFSAVCAAAICIKFTALALPVYLLPVCVARWMVSEPWTTFGSRQITSPTNRLQFMAAITGVAMAVTWVGIWAAYGFRYLPTPNRDLAFDVDYPSQLFGQNVLLRKRLEAQAHGETPPESMDVQLSRFQELCLIAQRYGILPQAFLQGVAYAHAMSSVGQSFLDGRRTVGGSWAYFPKAWLYKTPVAIIALASLSAVWAIGRAWRCGWRIGYDQWCLVLPFGVYLAMAMTYDLNIGIRHLLPAFPLVWIGIGCFAAAVIGRGLESQSGPSTGSQAATRSSRSAPPSRTIESERSPRGIRRSWKSGAVASLIALATLESLTEHPNYIPFFNWIARGDPHGLNRLSDSNLDWGQDLKLLAAWQRQHDDLPLYLSYFGSADPEAYGVRYINTPPGYFYGPPTVAPDDSRPGYLAFSATWLQGAYIPPGSLRSEVDRLRESAQPIAVLGKTIYIYQLPMAWKGRR